MLPGPERLQAIALVEPVSVAVKPAGVLPEVTVNVAGLMVRLGPLLPPPPQAKQSDRRATPAIRIRTLICKTSRVVKYGGRNWQGYGQRFTQRAKSIDAFHRGDVDFDGRRSCSSDNDQFQTPEDFVGHPLAPTSRRDSHEGCVWSKQAEQASLRCGPAGSRRPHACWARACVDAVRQVYVTDKL